MLKIKLDQPAISSAAEESPSLHFAIIGAGAGGLCAAKTLSQKGVKVTIFEIGSRIGGLWVYENDNGLSSAYRSLHINSEARVSSFGDFPFPQETPFYPDHLEMQRYLHSYAEAFGLVPRIRFRSKVTKVEPEGGRFRVKLEDGDDEFFDGVVVASGHQSSPRHPVEKGQFQGEYLHAHSYRVPEPFTGKRVLVIGPGNSGVDIAADICTVAARTVLSARSPVLIMPRMMFGLPNSRTLMLIERPWVPWTLRIKARVLLTRIFHGRMEQWGFRTPKTRTHPISHPTLISHIAWRRVIAKQAIREIKGLEVVFSNGSSETFDTLIAATGYRTEFPFLSKDASPETNTRLHLYQRTVHPAIPGLYFIGFFDVSGGSNIRMMDDQARFIAAVATGVVPLPSRPKMERAIAVEHAWAGRQFPGSARYGLELDPWRYRRSLARAYAAASRASRGASASTSLAKSLSLSTFGTSQSPDQQHG